MAKERFNGLEVVDAEEPLEVHVTKMDVRRGAAKKANQCAAALAICRAYDSEEALVGVARTYVRENGHYVRYNTPKRLREQIVQFDQTGVFEAGDYRISPVQPSVRLDAPTRKQGPLNGKFPQRAGAKLTKKYVVLDGIRRRMSPGWK